MKSNRNAKRKKAGIKKKTEAQFVRIRKPWFYLLSFSWGGLTSFFGLVIALFMLLTGHKAKRWGYSWYFETGKKNWGGMEWGPFFVKDKAQGDHLKNHEFGHGIQNCFFGPFMLIFVSAPSFFRYWARRIQEKKGRPLKTAYDDIWFEGQASRLGTEKIKRIRAEERRTFNRKRK